MENVDRTKGAICCCGNDRKRLGQPFGAGPASLSPQMFCCEKRQRLDTGLRDALGHCPQLLEEPPSWVCFHTLLKSHLKSCYILLATVPMWKVAPSPPDGEV